jgi:hypothetical protein
VIRDGNVPGLVQQLEGWNGGWRQALAIPLHTLVLIKFMGKPVRSLLKIGLACGWPYRYCVNPGKIMPVLIRNLLSCQTTACQSETPCLQYAQFNSALTNVEIYSRNASNCFLGGLKGRHHACTTPITRSEKAGKFTDISLRILLKARIGRSLCIAQQAVWKVHVPHPVSYSLTITTLRSAYSIIMTAYK